MSEYAVIYSSFTGNTEKIATVVYQAIPSTSKDIIQIDPSITKEFADNYFIGFNIDNGTAPTLVTAFIKQLHKKNIALFGTYGYSSDQTYINQLTNNISSILPSDNKYFGCFLCQGKMPISVRNKYKDMLCKDLHNSSIIKLINNFDAAMLHPNAEDEQNAANFVKNVIGEMNKYL